VSLARWFGDFFTGMEVERQPFMHPKANPADPRAAAGTRQGNLLFLRRGAPGHSPGSSIPAPGCQAGLAQVRHARSRRPHAVLVLTCQLGRNCYDYDVDPGRPPTFSIRPQEYWPGPLGDGQRLGFRTTPRYPT